MRWKNEVFQTNASTGSTLVEGLLGLLLGIVFTAAAFHLGVRQWVRFQCSHWVFLETRHRLNQPREWRLQWMGAKTYKKHFFIQLTPTSNGLQGTAYCRGYREQVEFLDL